MYIRAWAASPAIGLAEPLVLDAGPELRQALDALKERLDEQEMIGWLLAGWPAEREKE